MLPSGRWIVAFPTFLSNPSASTTLLVRRLHLKDSAVRPSMALSWTAAPPFQMNVIRKAHALRTPQIHSVNSTNSVTRLVWRDSAGTALVFLSLLLCQTSLFAHLSLHLSLLSVLLWTAFSSIVAAFQFNVSVSTTRLARQRVSMECAALPLTASFWIAARLSRTSIKNQAVTIQPLPKPPVSSTPSVMRWD